MQIEIAMNIIDQYPPVASLWPVKNSDYDLPEAILSMKEHCEEMDVLKDEYKWLKSEYDDMQETAREIKKDIDEKLTAMISGIEKLIYDRDKSAYKGIPDFIDELKLVASKLDRQLCDATEY